MLSVHLRVLAVLGALTACGFLEIFVPRTRWPAPHSQKQANMAGVVHSSRCSQATCFHRQRRMLRSNKAWQWNTITRDSPRARRVVQCASGCRKVAHQLFKPDAEKKNIVAHMTQVATDQGITVIAGPSRQGKSELGNLLVGSSVFSVSENPVQGHSFGGWVAEGRHGIILDTEGQSHQIHDSTKKLFCVTYPICNTFIFSSMELGADSFLDTMKQLCDVMDDFKKGSDASKPRLVLLLRDADARFNFQMRGERYVHAQTGKTVDDFVQESIVPALKHLGCLGLFSNISGLGIPSLKGRESGFDMVGELPRLLQLMKSPHAGPLIDINNPGVLESLVSNVNDNDGFHLSRFLQTAMRRLSKFQFEDDELQKKQIADNVKWDAEVLRSEFNQCKATISDHLDKFPNSDLNQELLRIGRNVEELAARIEAKVPVYKTVYEKEVTTSDEVRSVADGNYLSEGATSGATSLGALGTALGGPPAAALLGIAGGIIGAAVGEGKEKVRSVTVSVPKIVTVEKSKFVGYKLGRPTSTRSTDLLADNLVDRTLKRYTWHQDHLDDIAPRNLRNRITRPTNLFLNRGVSGALFHRGVPLVIPIRGVPLHTRSHVDGLPGLAPQEGHRAIIPKLRSVSSRNRGQLIRVFALRVTTCETIKELILKRRQSVDKDLKNLEKFQQRDRGHDKELNQKIGVLQKALKNWYDRNCGDDPAVAQVQKDVQKALQTMQSNPVVTVKNTKMTLIEVAAKIGLSVLVVAFLVEFWPLTLEALLISALRGKLG